MERNVVEARSSLFLSLEMESDVFESVLLQKNFGNSFSLTSRSKVKDRTRTRLVFIFFLQTAENFGFFPGFFSFKQVPCRKLRDRSLESHGLRTGI